MTPNIEFINILADAAAKQTLPRFRTNNKIDNKLTNDFDPVTEADRQAEKAIRDLIAQRYPAHNILGEEYGETNQNSDYTWVIDPIDGTRSFISGLPVWGTLIGLYYKEKAILGLMDQPFTRERYTADTKQSLYTGPDGKKTLKTSRCATLEDAILFTTSPHLFENEDKRQYEGLEKQVNLFRYGCDCYAFALLAGGHIDIVIEPGLKPYDIGGLISLVESAGGVVTTWDGKRPEKGGNIIATANLALHASALAALR